MSVIMGMLVVSALAGLVLGFYFELAALAVSGLILSVSAAVKECDCTSTAERK
jgi:hypothetical protein